MCKDAEKHTLEYKFDVAGNIRKQTFDKKYSMKEVKEYLNSCKIGYNLIENEITIKREDCYIIDKLKEIVRYLKYTNKDGNIIIKIL